MSRILVMDDDPYVRALVRFVLEREGHEVFDAPDGATGLRCFREVGADLVLCDIFMPEKDGLETILALRKESSRVKIVAVSGQLRGMVDYGKTALRFGADATIDKPFTANALLKAVRQHVAPPAPVRHLRTGSEG